jgi:hypothetical protein
LKVILQTYMCRNISTNVEWGQAEGLGCADPGARTPSALAEIFRGIISSMCFKFTKKLTNRHLAPYGSI